MAHTVHTPPVYPEPVRERLDTASDETFEQWAACGDERTLEEFAESGGRPMAPGNRWERQLQPGAMLDLRDFR
jgi:hypothetical protein